MLEWGGHFLIKRAGVTQPGKEKIPGRHHCDFPVLRGLIKKKRS